jgi:Ca2+-binding EF-hand superfamily protein
MQEVCDDGVDNDGDTFVDCDDENDCSTFAACRGTPGPEDNVAACTDGFDNDGDSYVDCDDFDCGSTGVCSDENTAETCSDGIDNDGNGFIDCDDNQCSQTNDPALQMLCPIENSVETCSNGIDDDGNGFIDCNDFSCSRCAGPDGDCISEDDRAARDYCRERGESNFEKCTDGVDNDGNGFIDCADFSCGGLESPRRAEDGTILEVDGDGYRSPCKESAAPRADDDDPAGIAAETAAARHNCTDGLDNDLDGFVDCEDYDCAWHPRLEGLCPIRVCE